MLYYISIKIEGEKRMKKVLTLVLCSVLILSLAGCGSKHSSSSKKIDEELNILMDEIAEKKDDFHVSTIQEYLEENSDYRLLDGNKNPFEEAPESPKDAYTFVEKNEQLINTNSNYVLIYDTKTKTYYSIPVGAVGYQPYFNEATKLK